MSEITEPHNLFTSRGMFIYNAYLLRLWQESPQAPFRASLQEVNSGRQHFFADLAGLFHFLESNQCPAKKEADLT